MKTFTFSMLVLISASTCLNGQGFGDSESGYYAEPSAIKASPNHFLKKTSSNRSGFANIPVGDLVLPVVVPSFEQSVEPERHEIGSSPIRFSPMPTKTIETVNKELGLKRLRPVLLKAVSKPRLVSTKPRPVSLSKLAPAASVKRAPVAPLAANENSGFKIIQTASSQEKPKRVSQSKRASAVPVNRASVVPLAENENSGFKIIQTASAQDVEIQAPPVGELPSPMEAYGARNQAAPSVQEGSGTRLGPQQGEIISEAEAPAAVEGLIFEPLPVDPRQEETRSREWEPAEQYEPTADESYSASWQHAERAERAEPSQYETYSAPWAHAGSTPLSNGEMFEQAESGQMRHLTDYFSPGGQPFAEESPRQDYFSAHPGKSCDEWSTFSHCGGLKAKPGHLGVPWLKSKDACDQSTRPIKDRRRIRFHGGPGCQSCGP